MVQSLTDGCKQIKFPNKLDCAHLAGIAKDKRITNHSARKTPCSAKAIRQ